MVTTHELSRDRNLLMVRDKPNPDLLLGGVPLKEDTYTRPLHRDLLIKGVGVDFVRSEDMIIKSRPKYAPLKPVQTDGNTSKSSVNTQKTASITDKDEIVNKSKLLKYGIIGLGVILGITILYKGYKLLTNSNKLG